MKSVPLPQNPLYISARISLLRISQLKAKYPEGKVPLPPTWGGYVVRLETVEFWQGRRGRMHDRLRYRRDGEGWVVERLAP